MASNVANGPRFAAQLVKEEWDSLFDQGGGLQQSVIDKSSEIINGTKLANSNVVKALQNLGGQISDWGKWATPTYRGPLGGLWQIHFYYNPILQLAYYGQDYKPVFVGAWKP